jgi:transcription initiation factor TFIIIB Brf1 subunit/transcription initiation factor TFIIB
MERAGCPSCGGPLAVNWQRGEVACTQCGLVVDDLVDTGPSGASTMRPSSRGCARPP